MGKFFNQLFQKALQGTGRARGMSRGFAGRAPRNFSPLGQAPRTAPPVPRATRGGGNNPIVGSRTARPSLRTPPKVNVRNASAVALGAGGLAAANSAPAGSIEDRINQVGPALDRFVSNLNFPGQQALSEYGREQEQRGFASLLDFTGGLLGPVAGRLIPNSAPTDPLAMRARYGGSGDMDAGPGGPSTLSELTAPATLNGIAGIVDVNPKTGKGIPGTFRRGDMDTDDAATFSRETGQYTFDSDRFTAKPPTSPTQADLPPSSEQVAPVDPYAYQLSVYGQGRQAAASQEAQKKVTDLGLAINRAMYPQFSRESYNPLMAATFPERYQKTPEDFVVQNGIQSPRSMINGDNSEALLAQEEENNIYKMDVAVDEVLKDVLNQARLRQQGS